MIVKEQSTSSTADKRELIVTMTDKARCGRDN
jgi:hypothetical protein